MQNIFNIMSGNCCFGIQLLTPSSISLTTSLSPHSLPCSGWLLSWTLFLLCCFPPCLFVPYFPFSVLSSVVVRLPPCLLSPFVSLLHPPHLTIAPQCEGWRETWAQWFISKDCTHYRGQDRGWMRGEKKILLHCFHFFPEATNDCGKFSLHNWISAS